MGKGGVVRDDAERRRAVDEVLEFAAGLGLEVAGAIEAPIRGAAGNQEFRGLDAPACARMMIERKEIISGLYKTALQRIFHTFRFASPLACIYADRR